MHDPLESKTAAEIVDLTLARTRRGSQSNNAAGSVQPAPSGLPPVLDIAQAARFLGIGRTLAYELVRADRWPTPVIRIGRLIRIPSGPLIELMSTGYPMDTAAS